MFNTFADPVAKKSWFGCSDDWDIEEFALDFRVGGREVNRGSPKGGGTTHSFNAIYQDIVPNERIVYSYDMHHASR